MLVCNAGLTTMFGAAHSMRLDRWQLDLDVNLTGTFRTIQACLPGMRERRYGRVIVISSTAAVHGMPAQASYSASKAGLLGLTKTVAAENVAHGITANVVLPGMTASSGMLAMPQEVIDAWLRGDADGRVRAHRGHRRGGRVLRPSGGGQDHRPGAHGRRRSRA